MVSFRPISPVFTGKNKMLEKIVDYRKSSILTCTVPLKYV